MRETQERIGLLKADSDTRFNLETEYRIKELDLIRKDVIKLLDRLNGMDDEAINEKRKQGLLETQVITLQASMMQVRACTNMCQGWCCCANLSSCHRTASDTNY